MNSDIKLFLMPLLLLLAGCAPSAESTRTPTPVLPPSQIVYSVPLQEFFPQLLEVMAIKSEVTVDDSLYRFVITGADINTGFVSAVYQYNYYRTTYETVRLEDDSEHPFGQEVRVEQQVPVNREERLTLIARPSPEGTVLTYTLNSNKGEPRAGAFYLEQILAELNLRFANAQ